MTRKNQGLLNVPQNVVWGCLDPDFDPLDRSLLLDAFVRTRINMYVAAKIQNTPFQVSFLSFLCKYICTFSQN